jgi:hypothetical protein
MKALDISALIEVAGDSFPISGAMLVDQLFEFFILFLSPPSFFQGWTILLYIVIVHHRYFLHHLVDQIPVVAVGGVVFGWLIIVFFEIADSGLASVIVECF